MSKPTALRTNKKITTQNADKKQREASKDRNGLHKIIKLVENGSGAPVNIKSRPTIKTTESPLSSTSNGIKRTLKNEVNKSEHKTKPKAENHKNSLTTPIKASPKVNKMPIKTSSSTNQVTLTKTKRTTVPQTPPSSRVTKTQFFPSKNMYSNVVKEQLNTKSVTQRANDAEATTSNGGLEKRPSALGESKIKNHKIKTVTKSNEKLKSPKSKNKIPHNTITETIGRPRTATLKRGSIVNSNIAGPDIPVSETPSLTSLDLGYEQEESKQEESKQENTKQEKDYDYEDDFDSYESDFEEYQSSDSLSSSNNDNVLSQEDETTSDDTSSFDDTPKQGGTVGTDEERMLDSGNFDMPENKHKQLLDNIKESNEQENFTIKLTEQSRSNMASLSDEGFEEGKSSLQSGNMQFINFADAQKKWKQGKNLEKRRKRGEEILNMIRLDHYYFTIIDMPPISYDDFIQSYGKTNTIQVPTQTGDDNISEEIQTDIIESTNKWTQFPVRFSKIDVTNVNYLDIYKKEFIGVGDDSIIKANSITEQDLTNSKRLKKFLSYARQIVLTLLEESNYGISEQIHKNHREIPFSSGYIKFDTNMHTFLANRPITFVSYYSSSYAKILTVHESNANHENHDDELYLKSIVCIWCVSNSKYPEQTLSVTGKLRVCCSPSDMKNSIFGGLEDGSIVIWSINEDTQLEVFNNNYKNYMQQPSCTTEIGCGHSSSIVSIQPLTNTTDNLVHSNLEWKSPNNQICSLDDNGNLIVWGVITKNNSSLNNFKQHTAIPWTYISLVQNSKISLRDINPDLTDLLCTDMNINLLDPRHLYISTNYGYIIHYLTTETKAHPKKFNPGTTLQANCVESCPFSPLYFFAGHDDGAIVLYSRLLERPLIIISNKDDAAQSGIQLIQWSHHRPCVFYAKDHCNTIHIWDLATSHLYPIYSVPFKEKITCMKLFPTLIKNNDTSYMILATEGGSVYLHILNTEYGPSTLDRYQQDMKLFLNCVSRL